MSDSTVPSYDPSGRSGRVESSSNTPSEPVLASMIAFLNEERKRVQSKKEATAAFTPNSNSNTNIDDPEKQTDDSVTALAVPVDAVSTPKKKPTLNDPGTPDTWGETPPSSPTANTPPPHFVVEQRSSPRSVGFFACLGPCRVPLICGLIIFLLIVTGAGGFLLQQFFRIPSLKNEIKELTKQIDRLEAENVKLRENIADLSVEIDRLELINKDLGSNITALVHEVDETEVLVNKLNSSINEYEAEVHELQATVTDYQRSLTEQNNTISDLRSVNGQLTVDVLNFKSSVTEYSLINDALRLEVTALNTTATGLNKTINLLDTEIKRFQNETATLQKLNQNLESVASFLNTSVYQSQQAYQDFVQYLADQIEIRRDLVLENLSLYYESFIDDWTCDFTSRFSVYDFGQDDTIPFGSYANVVITHIHQKDLEYLCIDLTDFVLYLKNVTLKGSQLTDTNLRHLQEAVAQYSSKLMDYYFPDNVSDYGLTVQNWDAASWNCNNIPANLKFNYQKYDLAVHSIRRRL